MAHTEQEIDTITWKGVFSGYKTGFVRLGHNYNKQFCSTFQLNLAVPAPYGCGLVLVLRGQALIDWRLRVPRPLFSVFV